MAHVELDASAAPPRLLVDGVDIAQVVAADSLVIREHAGTWAVDLTIIPRSVKVDLPDAVLNVERGEQ